MRTLGRTFPIQIGAAVSAPLWMALAGATDAAIHHFDVDNGDSILVEGTNGRGFLINSRHSGFCRSDRDSSAWSRVML